MNTREVAEYLRIKERKVYDLVRAKKIPCTRVTGKWLFPKHLIDLWVARSLELPRGAADLAATPPAVVVGSHDPLLEWSLRESQSALALHAGGSLDGVRRFAEGAAMVCGLHVFDAAAGDYNVPVVARACPGMDIVVIEWAWRQQGLIVAPGNPLGLAGMADLAERAARVVLRQPEAGSRLLFQHLLAEAGVDPAVLTTLAQAARSETDLGAAILEGKADAGLGLEAVARALRLDFVPLHRERFDLVVRRHDYFEPPFQALLAFARGETFRNRAAEMGGYDVSALGRVAYNGP
jgi:excisionase family DNA binding protein